MLPISALMQKILSQEKPARGFVNTMKHITMPISICNPPRLSQGAKAKIIKASLPAYESSFFSPSQKISGILKRTLQLRQRDCIGFSPISFLIGNYAEP
ncbi:hypothetical protein JO40_00190 [Treponema putidum]|nr:hypothetical protein JO40_00190 [Treponema putidum]